MKSNMTRAEMSFTAIPLRKCRNQTPSLLSFSSISAGSFAIVRRIDLGGKDNAAKNVDREILTGALEGFRGFQN
jgi:hypothetical protein